MNKVFHEKDLTPKGPGACAPPGGAVPGLRPMASEARSMGVAQGPGLRPIRHEEFNEFIKGKGFKGRNNYKLADLKAMFGFMATGSPVMISSDQLEPTRFDSMSKASTSTGIPYVTLLYAKKNSRQGAASAAPGAPECSHRVRSNGKEYTIIYH